jgi:hypothetical protein
VTWLLPTARLVDALRRHGFDVFSAEKYRETTAHEGNEGDAWTLIDRTYFVSRGGQVLATVRCGVIPAETITYGDADPVLISLASRYGSLSHRTIAPDFPRDAEYVGTRLVCTPVTSSAVMEVLWQVAAGLLFLIVMFAMLWLVFRFGPLPGT